MISPRLQRISVIDSHTAGEPTRIVLNGIPDLGGGSLADRCRVFRDRFDDFRSLVVNEPRGSDILVGALLVEPHEPDCSAGVIFFNNVGPLNMCGHGTIGLMITLAHLGRIAPGTHRIDTPVGVVTATLHEGNRVSLVNVPSYRFRKSVALDVPGLGQVTGDIAWGGNWFFLCADHGQELNVRNVERLTQVSWAIRRTLESNGITGEHGGEIDHIELTGPAHDPKNHGRNFVLCPGGAYDRSPCGTGTSAKLACLAAEGRLMPGDIWRQESILGTVFEGAYVPNADGTIAPTISGTAYITAETTLIVDPADELSDSNRD
jgi:4-hydroxyproline epimerase